MSYFPHFRNYKRSKHPALIVGHATKNKHRDSYMFRKVSHSTNMTQRGYEVVKPNPNPKDPDPMYIENKKRVDYKEKFGKRLPWEYPQKNK